MLIHVLEPLRTLDWFAQYVKRRHARSLDP
jgi:hypothetical protein